MRRALVLVVIAMVAFVAAVPSTGAAPTKTKTVSGEIDGAGGFVFDGSCPLIIYASSGTYRAKHLGRGTYALHMCITSTALLHAVGTFDLTTRRKAQLHGTIETDLLPTPLQGIPVTVAGGTDRFAGATGTLTLDIMQFNETGCDPRVSVCFFWDEHGTIGGTITPH